MDRAMWDIGDWLEGVENIDPETEYVYFRLCLFIYELDGVVKDDDQANARRCRVSTRAFRKHKAALVDCGKIEVRDGLIWNGRCERELAKVQAISDGAREKAEKRWRGEHKTKNGEKNAEKTRVFGGKNGEKTAENPEKPNEINESADTGAYAGAYANSGNSEDIYISSPCSPSSLVAEPDAEANGQEDGCPTEPDLDAEFEKWWQAYPRKVARGRARKAWMSIVTAKRATPEELLSGAQSYARARDGEPSEFTKHPATWLNGECWFDEDLAAGSDEISPEQRARDAAAAKANRERNERYAMRMHNEAVKKFGGGTVYKSLEEWRNRGAS